MGEPHREAQGCGEHSVFEMSECVQAKGKWRLKSSLQPIQLLGTGCISKGNGTPCQPQETTYFPNSHQGTSLRRGAAAPGRVRAGRGAGKTLFDSKLFLA